MIRFFKKQFQHYPRVMGLEIEWLENDGIMYHLVILHKQKQSILLEEKVEKIPAFESLQQYLKPGLPIAITFSGKGVIYKKQDTLPDQPGAILQTALPGGKQEDFIYQTDRMINTHSVCILRKDKAEKWIKALLDRSCPIVHLNVGVLGVRTIYALFDQPEKQVQIAGIDLQFQEGELENFNQHPERTHFNVTIASQQISSGLLPAFASAFCALTGQQATIYNAPAVERSRTDYFYQQLFKKLSLGILVFLFVVLLVNFLLLNWLSNKNQMMGLELAYHNKQLRQLDELKKEYQEKQVFFGQSNILRPSKISMYADAIGSSVPTAIQLLDLTLFPNKNIRSTAKNPDFHFDKTSIRIKGQTRQSLSLNEWIKLLEQFHWVEEVKVLPYTEKQNGVAAFELELNINN